MAFFFPCNFKDLPVVNGLMLNDSSVIKMILKWPRVVGSVNSTDDNIYIKLMIKIT